MRYAVIQQKNKREIVLLRGNGCAWRRCRFCDYHLDGSRDKDANFAINAAQLEQVTGCYGRLEVINSGSFAELDERTMDCIADTCRKKNIQFVHFESHWMFRDEIAPLRERFRKNGVTVKMKIGIETFDISFRENILCKGLDTDNPAEIAAYFDECCLLQGLPGQTGGSMRADIETGLQYFERICVNLMQENSAPVKPDRYVTEIFKKEIAPTYENNERVDILLNNTDFGVGVTPDAQ